jgi:hypothetical protein
MLADYLSRLPAAGQSDIADITECFDLFQPNLKDLQKAHKQLQDMNHFWTEGHWPKGLPKSEANYLQNLAPKLFQDKNGIIWI